MIPVNEPLLDGNERKYLLECIESGWVSSEGAFVSRFEEELANRVGRSFGIAVCNGTAALDIAVESLGLQPGDEVILPAFTIISCIAQIVRLGAVPVLVDSDPLTWNMDVARVEERVTPRTRAIMAVHIYGLPVDMDPLLSLARKYGIKIIEDAAEAHGQTYRGQPCGSFGDISTFSFYANKHVTTGEGGMLLTDEESLARECQGLRNLCFLPEKRFVHERLGWNYRMTNLQAAVGVAQLERLDTFVARKRRMGKSYARQLKGLPCTQFPLPSTDYAENVYWVFGIVVGEEHDMDAREVMRRLAEKGVGCRPFFAPMHEQPVLKSRGLFERETYPVAERLYRRGFYVPSGLALQDDQIDRVCEALWEILG